ncbi:hypothetical protein B1R32_10266 [Abditibacterium utsteinense]|uniref:DUF5666 domain-containing protein n=1 Tax=Abditibacterium utsteinense TaxID=1960156 RepID=A0A2S8SWB5_9BACT|nr:hypothetical protein [Abditibacterium utsteinense]PQV65059.1 hypothetical protein B1R32_10266 [Abditibacterium utsteinense]
MKNSKIVLFCALFAGAFSTSALRAQPKPSMARPISLTGIIAGSFMGREFLLRANGETYRVRPLAKVSLQGVKGGDRVRVWGRPTGLRVNFANVRVLTPRASSNPSDYNPAPGATTDGG